VDLKARLLELESEFWKSDEAFYDEHLSEDALMVFPEPVGVMDRDEILRSVAAGPRWAALRMLDARLLRLSEQSVVLAYKAEGTRQGEGKAYRTLASSVYVMSGQDWKLAFHQQSPTPEEA
jgi:hypothetical protein